MFSKEDDFSRNLLEDWKYLEYAIGVYTDQIRKLALWFENIRWMNVMRGIKNDIYWGGEEFRNGKKQIFLKRF